MALIALLTVSLSYALTIRIRNASTLGPLLGVAAQPVMLVSGMLLPLTLAPLWMLAIAKVNPFYWATNGMRDMFAGDLAVTSVWVSFVVVFALTVLTINWSLRLFTRDLR
jgi:ABC-2 type transport system permease protein